jgi:hypothetical protein
VARRRARRAKHLVHVRRTFTHGADGVPKSGRVRNVPLTDQAAKALDALSRRERFTADRLYVRWLSLPKPPSSCAACQNVDSASAKHEDALATAAKRHFVGAFNPLARALGLRTWSANQF